MRRFFSLICIFFISLAFNSKILADELGNLELPTGGEVVSGDISIQKEAGKLIINQNSSKGIIEWQKFNVGADASVYFNHKNNTDSILNQIIGGSKSIILGNIFSNGKLFVNNPNGITVGANASINAHSFIGSSMKIANQDFLNHNYHYKQDRESLIDQNGNIDAQYVALMATDVTNSGTIRSKNGSVNLAASDDMVLKISSDNSLQIKVKPSKLKATVSNKGIVIAENGVVTIKADMAQDAIAATIKAPENQAKGLVSKNGVIKLVSNSGTIKAKKVTLDAGQRGAVENTGKIDTSSATSKGGSVELIGKEVIIKSGSEIKSNGKKQGGNIYVGNPTLLNSVTDNTFVTLENNTVLDVSSLEDSAGVVKIRTGKSSNGSMTSVNGVILARTGSSRRKDLANVAVTGYDVNLNEIYIDVSSTSDSGGSIHIEATNDVVGGKISLISNGKNEGGDINVVSLFGDVNLQQSIVQTNASLGRGGTVNINAKQNIFLIDSNLYARGSPEGGNVTILSIANDVNLKSTLIQTNGSTGRGGTIELSGFNHTIIQSSSFYSKGSNKGGNIYIGNNFYEKTIPFSKYTYIDPYSIIDATSSNFGGFVETSGQILELLSKINVGYEGLWLIDPYDVTIASSGDSGTSYSSSFTPSETTTILASSVISSLNAGTSVSITTGSSTQNTLTVNAAIAKTSGSSATLTLTGGFIDINADISSTSDGLNLTLNAATMDITSNLSLNGGDLTINNSSDSTFSGVFSGSENSRLLKNGAGILTLNGTNTYSGATYLYNGTLIISSDANLGTAPAEATANHLYLSGGRLKTTTTMTLNSNRGMHLNTSWSYLEVADTTTLTYDGIITGTSTNYDLVLNYSGTTGTLVLGGTSTYVGSTKIYNGTLSISDELNLGPTTCNNRDCIDLYNAGVLQITDDVTFGNNQGIKISNSDNTKILIATGKTLTLNHEFYNNSNGAYVLTINDGSHDGKLHMTTSAVATSNSAYFSFTDSTNGGFVVDNGTLQLDDYRNLTYDSSYTSYLTMASGSTLILNETNQQQKLDLILQGATVELLQSQNWYGDVTLSGTNTFNVADGQTWTTSSGSWTNASGQTGAITKTGTGTLVLGNSTSTWTGLTTVTAGTLRTNTNNALGTNAGGVQVNGGVLDVRNTLADEITLNGGTLYGYGGTISNTITLSQNSTIEAGSTTTITGVITDGDNSYSVTKTGTGLLYLSGSSANTYDGGTTISAGEIEVRNHNDNLGTGTVTIDDGAGLDVYNRTINNSLIINGAYTSSYGNLFSSNTSNNTGTILMNAAASIGGNGTLTISGVIDDGGNNYTLTKIGTGTVYLTATNTYGGGTIIEDGYLGIANDDNLGDIPGSTDADNIQLGTSTATLFATADVTINTARGITLLADGNALGADSGDQLTYNGIITGDYNLTIARNASGTVVLGGTNTYSGSTNVSSGTLKISADANLGTAPLEATANHLYLSGGHLHTTATMTLNSNRGMHLNTSWSYLEVADTTTLTYDGIITGTSTNYDLVLNYSGTTGTLVLGGTSTYVGSTKIYNGTLSISDELNLGPTTCNSVDCIDLYNAGVLQITDDVTFGSNQGIDIANSDNTKILIANGKTVN